MMKHTRKKALAYFMILAICVTGLFGAADHSYAAVRHKTSTASYSLWFLANTFQDANGETQERDKESIQITFTDGAAGSLEEIGKAASYFEEIENIYPLSLFLDTGGGSQVSYPFEEIYTSAPYLRLTGAAGYDYISLGESQTVQGETALIEMLNQASNQGYLVPYTGMANLEMSEELKAAAESFGMEDYTVIGKYGKNIAVFSLAEMGENSAISYSNVNAKAKEVTQEIEDNENADLVICVVDFSGNEDMVSQAKELAQNTPDIDLIILSGAENQVQETANDGDTAIVGIAGDALAIGQIQFREEDGEYVFQSFDQNEIPGSTESSQVVETLLTSLEEEVDQEVFKPYGLSYFDTLTTLNFDLPSLADAETAEGDQGLTNFIADSYITGARSGAGLTDYVLLSAVSTEVLSAGLEAGDITPGEIAAMFLRDADMVTFTIDGKNLELLAELLTEHATEEETGRIALGGVSYTYNPHRFRGNRVYGLTVKDAEGNSSVVFSDQEYTVVSDTISYEALTDLIEDSDVSLSEASILSTGGESGLAMKSWYGTALSVKANGISESYQESDGRVVYDNSWNPLHLLREAGRGTKIVIAILIILIILLILYLLFKRWSNTSRGRYQIRQRTNRRNARNPYDYKVSRRKKRRSGGMFSRK